MLTFTSLGGTAVRLEGGERALTIYPTHAPKAGDIALFVTPEEDPRPNTISWPGEYDIAGITVRGVGQDEGKKVSYAIEVDGVRCAFIAMPMADWSEQDLEYLGDVDILVVPGTNVSVVQKLLDEVDPRVVILLPTEKNKIDPDVIKLCGAAAVSPISQYKVKGTLPQEGREVVILSE
jgi:hypothetical protein